MDNECTHSPVSARDIAVWMLSRLGYSKRSIMDVAKVRRETVDAIVIRLDGLPAHEIVDACPIMRGSGSRDDNVPYSDTNPEHSSMTPREAAEVFRAEASEEPIL